MASEQEMIKYDTVINTSVTDNSHSQLIRMVTEGSKVLDVGCASGVLGEYLAVELKCVVTGVDFDEGALRIARSRNCFHQVQKLDLENIDITVFNGERFDFIVLGDVVEHVNSSKVALAELVKCLKPEGKLLISLPNVAHGSIKLNLLSDRFAYTAEGILDETHKRFYTINSIVDFCDENSLALKQFGRVFTSVYGMEQEVKPSDYSRGVLRCVESDLESWVYQYVFSAQPVSIAPTSENRALIQPDASEIKRFNKIRRSKSRLKLWKMNK